MLFRSILLDSAIQPVSGREELIYNSLHRLLRDISKYGVVLIDDEGEMIKRFKSILDEWDKLSDFPEGSQAGRDLYRLFTSLAQGNRLISVSAQESEIACDFKACNKSMSIAYHQEPDFLLLGQECLTCAVKNLTPLKNIQALAVESCDRSEGFQKFTSIRGFEIPYGNWHQRDFESRVLIPLFKVTETVKLFDKQMGEYFDSNLGYKDTIEWFLKVFSKHSIPTSERYFEIYVGSVKSLNARREIRKFKEKIKSDYPNEFHFEVRWSLHYSHDRFLETDQVRVSIGRGFDLIQDTSGSYPYKLKEITIGYIDQVNV